MYIVNRPFRIGRTTYKAGDTVENPEARLIERGFVRQTKIVAPEVANENRSHESADGCFRQPESPTELSEQQAAE